METILKMKQNLQITFKYSKNVLFIVNINQELRNVLKIYYKNPNYIVILIRSKEKMQNLNSNKNMEIITTSTIHTLLLYHHNHHHYHHYFKRNNIILNTLPTSLYHVVMFSLLINTIHYY